MLKVLGNTQVFDLEEMVFRRIYTDEELDIIVEKKAAAELKSFCFPGQRKVGENYNT